MDFDSYMHSCAVCEATEGLRLCTECQQCCYCSKDCLKKDHTNHQKYCASFKKFKTLADLFQNDERYKSILIQHSTMPIGQIELKGRRLVQFDFSRPSDLDNMINPDFLMAGGQVDVKIRCALLNEEEDKQSQWYIAMAYTKYYDLEKEAAVAFTLKVDDGFLVKPFVIPLKPE
ncbi:hypothetical protein HDV04_000055 [Boothiomyces sp. JEL0838]|nr:hypothetical protein HDV04_000055 [Boothiomyces sp. JEL0838]